MTPRPYRSIHFQGTMVTLVVDEDAHSLIALSNRVFAVHAKVWPREEFEKDHQLVELADPSALVQLTLQQFKGYGVSVGLTPEAATCLRQHIDLSPTQLRDGVTKGMATMARIRKEAAKMEAEDKQAGTAKAPRKLGGAAAAAVARKEARLAAEAKQLAGQVSQDQAAAEQAGVVDATLPAAKPGRTKKTPAQQRDEQANPPPKGPKISKTTPSADQAKKILKGKARPDAQVSVDSQFDPTKLKGADGEYKSASAMFKGLLWEGKLSDDKIAAAVDKRFQLGDKKAKEYVKWNRGWFRRQGVTLPTAS